MCAETQVLGGSPSPLPNATLYESSFWFMQISMNVPAIMVAVVTVATIPKDLTTALAPVATN